MEGEAGAGHLHTVLQLVVYVPVGFCNFLFLIFPLFPQEKQKALHQRKLGSEIVTMICSCCFLRLSWAK